MGPIYKVIELNFNCVKNGTGTIWMIYGDGAEVFKASNKGKDVFG